MLSLSTQDNPEATVPPFTRTSTRVSPKRRRDFHPRYLPTMGKLCRYCAIIVSLQADPEAWSQDFPLRSVDDYAPLMHFRNVKDLIGSAGNCSLCDFIQSSWSLPDLLKRYPDIREDDYSLLELDFKITKASSPRDGVSCNFIGGDIMVPWHGFADSFKVTITTCHVGSMSRYTFASIMTTNDINRRG